MDRRCIVETGASAETLATILRVVFPDATPGLDATRGIGRFWAAGTASVVGLDRSSAAS